MKKSYFCERLNSEINFDALKIFFCCATRTGPGIDIPSPDKAEEIIKTRKILIKKLKNGEIPPECKGCFDLKEQKTDTFNLLKFFNPEPKQEKISRIIVKHFKQCDCGCIYCCEKYLSKGKIVLKPKKSDYYDLLPIIKTLYKKNLIDTENLDVHFQGGNVSVLEEFTDLAQEFHSHGVKRIEIATNAIKYLPVIEEFCKNTFVDINVSIDSGCRETFKKIKTVDKFEDVTENLKKYIKLPLQLRLKYILVKGYNDNLEELTKYIELMKEIGIKNSELMIDQCDPGFTDGNGFKIPEHYYELFDTYQKMCKENDIYPGIWEYVKEILNKGEFFK